MKKLDYSLVIIPLSISYILDYSLLWTAILSIMSITLWNLIIEAPSVFGYVKKEKLDQAYRELEDVKRDRDAIKNKIDVLETDLDNINNTVKISKEEVKRIKESAYEELIALFIKDPFSFQMAASAYFSKQKRSYNPNREPNYGTKAENWRKVLRVSATATKTEVDKAFKDLVKRYHPDVNKEPGAKDMMQQINEAKDLADKYFATT